MTNFGIEPKYFCKNIKTMGVHAFPSSYNRNDPVNIFDIAGEFGEDLLDGLFDNPNSEVSSFQINAMHAGLMSLPSVAGSSDPAYETPNMDWIYYNNDVDHLYTQIAQASFSVTVTVTFPGDNEDAGGGGGNGPSTPAKVTPSPDPYIKRLFGTHWCGPGGEGPTVNQLDAACKAHDECYDRLGYTALSNFSLIQDPGLQACNQALCDAAKKSSDLGATRVRLYFSLIPKDYCK
jgi:hypothetical protein